MKKKIRVTTTDVNRGKRGLADSCPMALALCRELGPGWRTDGEEIYRLEPGYIGVGAPRSVERFVAAFDAGSEVRPFTFTVDLPAPERKSGP